MPNGVVSLLDDEHTEKIETIWEEFQDKFGVHGSSMTPIPHFSYHVAEGYERDAVLQIMREIADDAPKITVRTAGLGIFPAAHPVVYVALVRDPVLTALHNRLWEALDSHAKDSDPYYHPDSWVPHITIAHNDFTSEQLPQIIEHLSTYNFNWTMEITALALIEETEPQKHRVTERFSFQSDS